MMKSVKVKIAHTGARIVRDIARKASGTASLFGLCQPKEPQMLNRKK